MRHCGDLYRLTTFASPDFVCLCAGPTPVSCIKVSRPAWCERLLRFHSLFLHPSRVREASEGVFNPKRSCCRQKCPLPSTMVEHRPCSYMPFQKRRLVPTEKVIPCKGTLKWAKGWPEHEKLCPKFWWNGNKDANILFPWRITRLSLYGKDFCRSFLLEEQVDQE